MLLRDLNGIYFLIMIDIELHFPVIDNLISQCSDGVEEDVENLIFFI